MKRIDDYQDSFAEGNMSAFNADDPSDKKNLTETPEVLQMDVTESAEIAGETVEQEQQEIEIVEKGDDKLFALAADGSDHAKFAFKLIVHEFIKENMFLAVYIYNSLHNEEYNFRNQREVVTDLYDTLIHTTFTDTKGHLITQDFKSEYEHPIDQVNRIASKNKANYLFCGYHGLKGPKCHNAQLTIGLDYLLREGRSPMILIKDKNLRGENRKKTEEGFTGYKWLFLFDRAYSDCLRLLTIFLPLINLKRDFIYGLTLLPSYILYDDIKKPFLAQLTEWGLNEMQYDYQQEEYLKEPSQIVTELVNFGEDHLFNFVVLYNNPNKYRTEKEKSEVLKIIQKCSANICFVNGVYLPY